MDMWNLVIFEHFRKHCYLEGCYEDFNEAHKRGKRICGEIPRLRVRDYKVMSETEYIQFRNPYF